MSPSLHWRTSNSGRAYTLSGDIAKAKAAYQDFLVLWKDADPDILILKQATAQLCENSTWRMKGNSDITDWGRVADHPRVIARCLDAKRRFARYSDEMS